MTTDEAIARTFLLATGKTTAPAEGNAKYTKILALLNMFKDTWANEPYIDWNSLRSYATLAVAVSATDTFAIPATVGKISKKEGDFVVIDHTDGTNHSYYTIVPGAQLYRSNAEDGRDGVCAIVGSNLVFEDAFTATSPQFGGVIRIPRYSTPADMTGGTGVVPVDDPNYVCFMAAAEYVRNDITKQNQYGNLVAQAANSMEGMKERNEAQSEEVFSEAWSPLGETW